MPSILIRPFITRKLVLLLAGSLVIGCASVQTPTGGPKDRTPPKVVEELPKNQTRNFKDKEIRIRFDEFVKLSNEFKEVSISPAMDKFPIYKAVKNVLTIKLQDTLQANTTYTINFGKGIVDYNEGNILRNYSYVFSTGDKIDSVSISGNVIETLTKKPEIEIPVFIIPVRQDSIFGKRSASIFTSTDSAGNFSLKNLKPDTYRIYALNEGQGGDRTYNNANEGIAFQKEPIVLTKNLDGLKLETFKQPPSFISVQDRKIEADGRLTFRINQPLEKPSLKIISSEELNRIKLYDFNRAGDSAQIWLPELNFDSVAVAFQSGDISVDTVVLRRSKRDTYTRSVLLKDNTNNNTITPTNGLSITFTSPVSTFDQSKITLFDDTTSVSGLEIRKDTSNIRRYKINYPWKPGRLYSVRFADGAFSGPYGSSKYFTSKFRLASPNDFGDLTYNFTLPDSATYLIQTIRPENEIIKQESVTKNGTIQYRNVPIGRYTVRVIYDANKNGKWDTGNVKLGIQPEKIWNYPSEIVLRPNWESINQLTIPSQGP